MKIFYLFNIYVSNYLGRQLYMKVILSKSYTLGVGFVVVRCSYCYFMYLFTLLTSIPDNSNFLIFHKAVYKFDSNLSFLWFSEKMILLSSIHEKRRFAFFPPFVRLQHKLGHWWLYAQYFIMLPYFSSESCLLQWM